MVKDTKQSPLRFARNGKAQNNCCWTRYFQNCR